MGGYGGTRERYGLVGNWAILGLINTWGFARVVKWVTGLWGALYRATSAINIGRWTIGRNVTGLSSDIFRVGFVYHRGVIHFVGWDLYRFNWNFVFFVNHGQYIF